LSDVGRCQNNCTEVGRLTSVSMHETTIAHKTVSLVLTNMWTRSLCQNLKFMKAAIINLPYISWVPSSAFLH